YECTGPTVAALRKHLVSVHRGESFGNGRYARQLLDAAITRHARRTRQIKDPTIDDLCVLLPQDIPAPITPSHVAGSKKEAVPCRARVRRPPPPCARRRRGRGPAAKHVRWEPESPVPRPPRGRPPGSRRPRRGLRSTRVRPRSLRVRGAGGPPRAQQALRVAL